MTIYCKPTTPPSGVGIDHNPDLKIYIPAESVKDYIANAEWSDYDRYFIGYDFD